MIGTTRLSPQPCPRCQHRLDSATSISEDVYSPKPQDYTVCLNCQQILQFDAYMFLQPRRFDEVADEAKAEIARLIVAMQKFIPYWKASKN
jgi:hypothetical protein